MLVSIIMPSFNCAKYVADTIHSVQAQTHTHWELIIADDCSTDDSAKVIAKLIKNDKRIRFIKCNENGGPARARNTALAEVRGRYVAFLDSDDIWLPKKIERTLKTLVERDASLVCTGFRRFFEHENGDARTGDFIGVRPTYTYERLLGGNEIATSTVLIDTHNTGPISMSDVYYDDFDCWLSLLKRGLLVCGLNEDLMRYRILPGSVSRNKLRSAYFHWDSLRRLQNLSLPKALMYFSFYAVRGAIKYRKI